MAHVVVTHPFWPLASPQWQHDPPRGGPYSGGYYASVSRGEEGSVRSRAGATRFPVLDLALARGASSGSDPLFCACFSCRARQPMRRCSGWSASACAVTTLSTSLGRASTSKTPPPRPSSTAATQAPCTPRRSGLGLRLRCRARPPPSGGPTCLAALPASRCGRHECPCTSAGTNTKHKRNTQPTYRALELAVFGALVCRSSQAGLLAPGLVKISAQVSGAISTSVHQTVCEWVESTCSASQQAAM